MYEIIKSVIQSKDYKLRDMLYKINKMYIESAITEAQKTELDELARTNANAENSYKDNSKQIETIFAELENIKARLDKLEGIEPPIEEYPEYVQPSGAHDAYKVGDKITFEGKKYICKMDGCVWSPEEYPQAWEEIVKTTESEG